jgi:signal transduction histidine kinase
MIEKIYDPFFSARTGGMGLGMTNVKNILIQHNSLLSVESEEGIGTTFRIKVPK